jgi:hypothetical protein
MTPSPETRSGMGASFAVFVAIAAFLLAGLAIVVGNDSSSGAAHTPTGPIAVTLADFTITPNAMEATAGKVTMNITNAGAVVHNLSIPSLNFVSADIAAAWPGIAQMTS